MASLPQPRLLQPARLLAATLLACCLTLATAWDQGFCCGTGYYGSHGETCVPWINKHKCQKKGYHVRWGKKCRKYPGPIGDPHVAGFDGSDYLLWGKPNTTYDLLSERTHQVNIRLYHPPGRAEAHALYIEAVGVMINAARIAVQLVPPVPEAAAAPAAVVLMVNGAQEPIKWTGQAVERAVDAHTSYAFRNEHHIVISSTDITMSVVVMENDHLDVHVEEVATYWSDVHGIMGQTYAAAFRLVYNYGKGSAVGTLPDNAVTAKKQLALKGTEDDYITSGLFETDDKFSRFVGVAAVVSRKVLAAAETSKVECNAGLTAGGGTTTPSAQRGRALLGDYGYSNYVCS